MATRSGAGRLTASSLHRELRAAFDEYDGKATTILGEARAAFGGEPDFLDTLIDLAADETWEVSSGATWLLRQHLEEGGQFTAAQTAQLVIAMTGLAHWSALLHFCQSVRQLELDGGQAQEIADWLALLHDHKRPFVRAWALDAVVSLGRRFEALRPIARGALAKAGSDTAASVRARARNLDVP